MSADKSYKVLFLCTGNSARSIIAEAILNRDGGGQFKAYSAGSFPAGEINPYAADLLERMGFVVSNLGSKSWEEFSAPDAPALDFVFTVCDRAAAETCPVWPCQPMTAHWGLADPAALEGSEAEKRAAFNETFRVLNNRIGIFVSLPFESLDEPTLKRRLEEVGRSLPAV